MVQTSVVIIATAAFSAASSLALPTELNEHDHFVREEDNSVARNEASLFNSFFPQFSKFHIGFPIHKGPSKIPEGPPKLNHQGALKVPERPHLHSNSNSQPQQPQQRQGGFLGKLDGGFLGKLEGGVLGKLEGGFLGKLGGFLGHREEDELSARDYEDSIYGREYAVDDLD